MRLREARDATILRAIKTAETINDKAEDEFRREVDEKEDNKPSRKYKPCSLLLRSELDSYCLQFASGDSVAPSQIHDGVLDRRRQVVPVPDKLP